MKTLFLVLMMSVFSLSLFAGDDVGNGGDVVLCQKQGEKSAQLLDYYESQFRSYGIDLGPSDLSVEEKIDLALSRLNGVDAYFSNFLKKKAEDFFKQAAFLPGITLTDVSDSNEVFLGTDCEIHQIAINKSVVYPGEPKFTVSKDLWEMLDNDNKAGLVLHEIIYDYLINQEFKNSRAARYLNGRISSATFESVTSREYQEVRRKIGYVHKANLFAVKNDYPITSGNIYHFVTTYGGAYGNDFAGCTTHREFSFGKSFKSRFEIIERSWNEGSSAVGLGQCPDSEHQLNSRTQPTVKIYVVTKKFAQAVLKRNLARYNEHTDYCDQYRVAHSNDNDTFCTRNDILGVKVGTFPITNEMLSFTEVETLFLTEHKDPRYAGILREIDQKVSLREPYLFTSLESTSFWDYPHKSEASVHEKLIEIRKGEIDVGMSPIHSREMKNPTEIGAMLETGYGLERDDQNLESLDENFEFRSLLKQLKLAHYAIEDQSGRSAIARDGEVISSIRFDTRLWKTIKAVVRINPSQYTYCSGELIYDYVITRQDGNNYIFQARAARTLFPHDILTRSELPECRDFNRDMEKRVANAKEITLSLEFSDDYKELRYKGHVFKAFEY